MILFSKVTSEPPTTNRLAAESSPYLLLHQHNPVDWYPWGDEALERARVEDKPIFLSVGYSTCYWCHVMERESFSDPSIAELMNRGFINIKVDREEHPELDEIYMAATQVLTHQGGWPNSVFLTGNLKPFFAGTYFPPRDQHGRPGFANVLNSLAEAWQSRRSEVEQQAEGISNSLRRLLEERDAPAGQLPGDEVVSRSLVSLERSFDSEWGGFGGAPKFPTPSNLLLLLELADEQPSAARMLSITLDQMARGGIFDQLAGGFHRYATDREWKIPHFEKMLYDNGLLLEIYAREWQRSHQPAIAHWARATAAFIASEMTSPEGAFWSAIDAETDGHEGAYYVWTQEELREELGEEDFGFLAPVLGFQGSAFFEGGSYVLHLPQPLEEMATSRQMTTEELLGQIEPLRAKLLEVRGRRQRPLTDDKILADWNGLAIAGLATAGHLLGEPEMVEQAARAAEHVLGVMRTPAGVLLHSWRAGTGHIEAFLGDYVFLVHGLLALHQATGEGRWLEAASELTSQQCDRLADSRGGFFVAAERADVLFRSKEIFDGALPGANAVASLNLIRLGGATNDSRWWELAEATLKAFAPLIERHPEAVKTMAVATRWWHRRVQGDSDAPGAPELASPPGAPVDEESERVTSRLRLEKPDATGWRPFGLELTVASGWHLYAHEMAEDLGLPTRVRGRGVELRDLDYPPGTETQLGAGGDTVPLYTGTVEIRGWLKAEEGENAALLVELQTCDATRCLKPTEIVVRLEA